MSVESQVVTGTASNPAASLCEPWNSGTCYVLDDLLPSSSPGNLTILTGAPSNVTGFAGNALLLVEPSAIPTVRVQNLSCAPFSGSFDAATSTAYFTCANRTVGAIVGFNLTTRAVTAVPIQNWVYSPQFDRRSQSFFAPGWGATGAVDTLFQISATNGTERARGTFPWANAGEDIVVLLESRGVLLVSDSGRGGLDVLSTLDGSLLRTLPVQGTITSVSVDSASGLIFVGSSGSTVAAFNSTTFSPETAFVLPSWTSSFRGPSAMTPDPVHGDLYVADGLSVIAFNLTTRGVVGTFPAGVGFTLGPSHQLYDPVKDRLYESETGDGGLGIVTLTHTLSAPPPSPISDLQILLVGALLGAVVGAVAYGAVRSGRYPLRNRVQPAPTGSKPR